MSGPTAQGVSDAAHVDVIELGTPLIKHEGIAAAPVSQMRPSPPPTMRRGS